MKSQSKCFLFCVCGIITLILGVWLQTGWFEYIRLDDNVYTWNYPNVAGGFSWANWKNVICNLTQGGIWMPITFLTYMLDISIFGAGPGPHHLMSVFWHSANAILVMCLIYELSDRKSLFVAFVATAFWAVHSQRCESVAWIASRKDLLFTFFALLGLIAWREGNSVVSYFLMFASCCCKPTAMVFPVIAFCVERHSASIFSRIRTSPIETLKTYLRRYAPLLLMTVATAILTVYSQTHAEDTTRGLNEGYGTFSWRCLNAIVALGLYIAQTIIPYGIHILYRSHVNQMPAGLFLGLFVVVSIVAGLVWIYTKHRSCSLVWLMVLWYLAAIGPTLGVAGGFGCHARADRFLYLPSIAISVLMAWGLSKIELGKIRRVSLVVVILCYAVAAYFNAQTYRCDYTLFSHAYEHDDEHAKALQYMATEVCARFSNPDLGIQMYQHVLELDPNNEGCTAQLVYALALRAKPGDFDEVRKLCVKLSVNPKLDNTGMASEALAIVSMRSGNFKEAIPLFIAALDAPKRQLPKDEALCQLAICQYNVGEKEKAEALLRQLVNSDIPAIREKSRNALQHIWTRKHPRN